MDGYTVAFDLLTETTHLIAGEAVALVLSCDQPTTIEALATEVTALSGQPTDMVTDHLDQAVRILDELDLIGDRDAYIPPEPWPGSPLAGRGQPTGRTHMILELGLAFRSSDPSLLDELDGVFGPGMEGRSPDVVIDAEPQPNGGVTINAANEWAYPTRSECVAAIVTVVNEYASRSSTIAVVHAGGVRTPDGQIWLLPGVMNAGKSTLVAALVQAGCDYLGDESIGVRAESLHAVGYPKPLSLDDSSCEVLGRPPSDGVPTPVTDIRADTKRLTDTRQPITRVILPRFVHGADIHVEDLTPAAVLRELLGNTSNLALVGSSGLQTICDVAATVPASRVTHADAVALASHLIQGTI